MPICYICMYPVPAIHMCLYVWFLHMTCDLRMHLSLLLRPVAPMISAAYKMHQYHPVYAGPVRPARRGIDGALTTELPGWAIDSCDLAVDCGLDQRELRVAVGLS